MLVKQIPSAAIVIIAASFSVCCESRDTGIQAGYNVQPGKKYDSRRKQNDAAFLIEAANDLSLEAQLAELAVKKAASPGVKEFAVSVLTDHRIAMDEIREMASRANVELPDDLPAAHRKHFLRIAKKDGLQFDRAFCTFLFQNNTMSLKKFERIAQEGSNTVVKEWAFGKLGILRRHIAIARDIERGGGSEASASAGSLIQ